MPVVTPEKLAALQRNPNDIRNICILAHVDHGKTSLTDSLIATNGLISPKLAGKIRYLDSRPDEQLRGITMEASAISLCFSMSRRRGPDSTPEQKDYLINLIDSPGHIDFSSEVSTASRLCDGAVILVDVVEGVCSQTVTVLRQAWVEQLKPLLVFNKIDRLINELKLTTGEAYVHINKLLEQVNAVLGSFFQGERMEEDLLWRENIEKRLDATTIKERGEPDNQTSGRGKESEDDMLDPLIAETYTNFKEKDDEDIYFAPENNNVIFSSAIDGWAFTIQQFAVFYEKKLGIKRSILEKVLWGDYYLDPKTKRILNAKHLKGRTLQPMFVQLVLENIWAVYGATVGRSDEKGSAIVEKIIKSLSLQVSPYILRSRDPRALLTTIFASWLPLSTALLVSVIEQLPAPPIAQATRLPTLIDSSIGASHVDFNVRDAVISFKTSRNDPLVAFVSKMVAVSASELPQNKKKSGTILTADEARRMAQKKRAELAKAQIATEDPAEGLDAITAELGITSVDSQNDEMKQVQDAEQLIGFARLYSGTLNVGDWVFVLPPKFSPANPYNAPAPAKAKVTGLFLLMGRGLEPLESVPAGVVFGIAGLEGYILKSGTICSQLEGSINLGGIMTANQAIVRVALEPTNPSDLGKMIHGLQLLEQSDPCARYEVLESGEHVILTAGELHLERCLKDLRERFARCDIQAGEPIVPYRESIVNAVEMAQVKDKVLPRGTVCGLTTSKQISIRLRVQPLPIPITEFLKQNSAAIVQFSSERRAEDESRLAGNRQQVQSTERQHVNEVKDTPDSGFSSFADFTEGLKSALAQDKEEVDFWVNAIDNIIAFGPRRVGPNLLVDGTEQNILQKYSQEGRTETKSFNNSKEAENGPGVFTPQDFAGNITHAFQLATNQGPLCNEPVQGIAVILEEVVITNHSDQEPMVRDHLGRLTSEVIKIVRESIRQGFLDWSPRLFLAMYSCEIQASAEVLGRVYGVITRRRGRILSETMKEGTPFFTINSLLPVAESFGFSDEIRKRTSGAASPQLIFRGFEMLDEDPFWVPFTDDELEDLGELADKDNVAKRYMDRVRVRKGLVVVGKKLVKDAEKQKTLKKN